MRPSPPRTEAAPPGEPLARFARLRGLPVLEALGVYWVRRGRHVYQSVPPQRGFTFEPRELDVALRRARVLGLQYPTQDGVGEPGGLFVCRTAGFTLERLTKTRRARVRKGLALAELRRMTPQELLEQGLVLNRETMARQHRYSAEFGEPGRWARFVDAVRACPEVSVFGAYVEGRLATYALTCQEGRWVHGIIKMQRTEDLRRNTSSALDAWILGELAKDPGVEVLVNGLALGPDNPLFEYKHSLGFEVLPQRRVLRLHPALRVLARPALARSTGALARRLPHVGPLRAVANLTAAAVASAPQLSGEGAQP